jgi:protein tyrosine/serine phosphatase
VAAVAAARAGPLPEAACANFGAVAPGVYRGAEPGGACLANLARLGVRTIVDLRDDEDRTRQERSGAAALGLRYWNLPMSAFGRPSRETVRRVLEVVGAPENQPVFVHCKRGRDRTGVVVAAYRMVHDGWAAGRASQEAESFGLAWWQFGMKSFIRSFDPGGSRAGERNGAEGSGDRCPAPGGERGAGGGSLKEEGG